jgi:tyrosyl-tRNA synthetase
MSKTTGNHIGINEAPEVMFGKVMSIPDNAMRNYADLVTRWSPQEILANFDCLAAGSIHPRDLKMRLAREIVAVFHGPEAAAGAEEYFRTVFQERELPSEMPEITLSAPTSLADLVMNSGLVSSKSELRRLVQQGGIRLDGNKIEDPNLIIDPMGVCVLQIGRRKFLRVSGM